MVSFQKIVIMGAQEDYFGPPPRHIIADVVLMDTTHPETGKPSLYQVRESEFSTEQTDIPVNSMTQVDDDLFMMVGQVIHHDRKNRQIQLANEDLVTYRYLIVVGGPHHAEHFHPALQTLLESLRVQRSVKPKDLIPPSHLGLMPDHRVHQQHTALGCASVIADSGRASVGDSRQAFTSAACSIQIA